MFLQHGLKCSSADWVTGGLAYILVDAGFDVWLGNFRGNNYSLDHEWLTKEQKAFWDFSWDHHGSHDLPAMIDYARTYDRVGAERAAGLAEDDSEHKISFLGHSMGSTAFFVMMNEQPLYNCIITQSVLLAPVTNISSAFGYPSRFLSMAKVSIGVANAFGLHSINLPKWLLGYSHVSAPILYALGYHEMDPKMFRDIITFSPASTSTRNILHYLASKERDYFGNYNDTKSYSLSAVNCPVEIYWSANDWASGKSDVDAIAAQLINARVRVNEVKAENFGHLDFMWSSAAKETYKEVVEVISAQEKMDENGNAIESVGVAEV